MKAHRWLVAATALEALPRLSDALVSGELGLDKVVELARYATRETERGLIAWATSVSPGGSVGVPSSSLVARLRPSPLRMTSADSAGG